MKIHVFATIMALYPMTSTEKLSQEFGISVYKLRAMAKKFHVEKSREYRSEVCRQNGLKGLEKIRKGKTLNIKH